MSEAGVCILAGGEATRLPGKLALDVGELPMLVRVYRNVSPGRTTWLSTKGPLPPELAAHIEGLEAYLKEMRPARVTLPTMTFDHRLVIHQQDGDLVLGERGCGFGDK